MTTITTSPPKPPEPELMAGPWDIMGWESRLVEDCSRMAVVVTVVHRATGECRTNGASVALGSRSNAEAIAAGECALQLWVDDLNAAEWEEQPA